MILRKGQAPVVSESVDRAEYGPFDSQRLSEAGGLTQFGAYVETLHPGSRSAEPHWHEEEDEFLYVLAGEATVIEDDREHVLKPGDTACWPAGVANAHHVVNASDAPCMYLICGTRVPRDVVHYPEVGKVLYIDGRNWRLLGPDGNVIKEGVE